MRGRRTWWHLESLDRKPSDYEIASQRLTFAPQPGTSVITPMADFFRLYGPNARLTLVDWERFVDPAETTYARYVERQRDRELVIQNLFDGMDSSGYDTNLAPAWRAELGETVSALRFAGHGLQMASSYLGRMAAASPIIIAFAFQAADELRRVQRFAYRLRQLADCDPSLPERGRLAWQTDSAWQPLRRVLEELLVTWDWADCFAALTLLLKPALDELVLVQWPKVAAAAGDPLLPLVAASLYLDCRWHSDVAQTLGRLVVAGRASNRALLSAALERWQPPIDAAVATLARRLLGPNEPDARMLELVRNRDDALRALLGGTP